MTQKGVRSFKGNPILLPEGRVSDCADTFIDAIVLGLESQTDCKEALAFQKEIKLQMQLNYQPARRGRPHIERR
jgi:hypothetical protein